MSARARIRRAVISSCTVGSAVKPSKETCPRKSSHLSLLLSRVLKTLVAHHHQSLCLGTRSFLPD